MSEIAWAAGFFDGEGHAQLRRGRSFRIVVPQVERTTLDRFAAAVGGGKVYGPYARKSPTQRAQFQYQADGEVAFAAVIAMYPWLSGPKRKQVDEARRGMGLAPISAGVTSRSFAA